MTLRIGNKEIRKLMALAHRQGWRVSHTGGGHLKWVPPEGDFIITASTPDSQRSFTNDKKLLECAGLLTTLDEVKRAEKAKQSNPTQEEVQVPNNWTCRHEDCNDAFGTMAQRDGHEQYGCKLKPLPEAIKPPKRIRPKQMCAYCSQELTAQNMSRHVALKHPGADLVAVEPEPDPFKHVIIRKYGTIDNRPVVNRLVEVVFPDGPPLEPAKLMALASWLESTESFLQEVGA